MAHCCRRTLEARGSQRPQKTRGESARRQQAARIRAAQGSREKEGRTRRHDSKNPPRSVAKSQGRKNQLAASYAQGGVLSSDPRQTSGTLTRRTQAEFFHVQGSTNFTVPGVESNRETRARRQADALHRLRRDRVAAPEQSGVEPPHSKQISRSGATPRRRRRSRAFRGRRALHRRGCATRSRDRNRYRGR